MRAVGAKNRRPENASQSDQIYSLLEPSASWVAEVLILGGDDLLPIDEPFFTLLLARS